MRCCLGLLAAAVFVSGTARADYADAIKLVERLGGKITRDPNQPGEPVIGVDLSSRLVTDAVVKELIQLKQLTALDLRHTQVTDAALENLKELKQLTTLDLTYTHVTEVG